MHSSASGAFFGDGECLLAVDAQNVTADGQGVLQLVLQDDRVGVFWDGGVAAA